MKYLTLITICAASSVACSDDKEPMPVTQSISVENGTAVGGYDPVTYFEGGEPAVGNDTQSHTWNGATWHFVSQQNRDKFVANPDNYAPQFGGFCAFAMSLGKQVPGSPKTWSVVDNKLYLNANTVAKVLWKIVPGRIAAGDATWAGAAL